MWLWQKVPRIGNLLTPFVIDQSSALVTIASSGFTNQSVTYATALSGLSATVPRTVRLAVVEVEISPYAFVATTPSFVNAQLVLIDPTSLQSIPSTAITPLSTTNRTRFRGTLPLQKVGFTESGSSNIAFELIFNNLSANATSLTFTYSVMFWLSREII